MQKYTGENLSRNQKRKSTLLETNRGGKNWGERGPGVRRRKGEGRHLSQVVLQKKGGWRGLKARGRGMSPNLKGGVEVERMLVDRKKAVQGGRWRGPNL